MGVIMHSMIKIKMMAIYKPFAAKEKYRKKTAELEREHQATISKLSDHQEIKDEKYVYKTLSI